MKFFIFPGQGSQYAGMGKDWTENFKEAALAYEEASDGCGLKLKRLCFEGPDYDLRQTEITQPAILTTTVAIWRALVAQGMLSQSLLKDSLCAGHSLGEYSALVCAGVLTLGEAARLVHHRGQYMQASVPAGLGAMSALVFKPKSDGTGLAEKICARAAQDTGHAVSVANFNSPEQIVISGYADAVERAAVLAVTEEFGARKAVPLPVSAPFHCALMQTAADKLSPELKSARWKAGQLPYIANVDATLHSVGSDAEAQKACGRLIDQITGSVQWVKSVQHAMERGATEAVEIGPGAVLSGLVKRISLNEKTLATKNVDTWKGFKDAGALI